jgi:hypothetical protein
MAQPQPDPTSQSSAAYPIDRTTALYERPPVAIADPGTFGEVSEAIQNSFAAGNVDRFLKSLQRGGLRIREFEQVLRSGKLGSTAAGLYDRLTAGDQGRIRELYLAALEQVDLALRDKYFRLYAYY